MSHCRACACRDERTAQAESSTTAVLVLRAWHEAHGVVCRLVPATKSDTMSDDPNRTVAVGEDAVCNAVRDWLNTF